MSKKKKYNVDKKNNSLNFNLKIIQNHIRNNLEYIDNNFAEFLNNELELIKDNSKKCNGLVKQKGHKIYDDINKKEYISINEAVRATNLTRKEIENSLNTGKLIQKAFRFKDDENE